MGVVFSHSINTISALFCLLKPFSFVICMLGSGVDLEGSSSCSGRLSSFLRIILIAVYFKRSHSDNQVVLS